MISATIRPAGLMLSMSAETCPISSSPSSASPSNMPSFALPCPSSSFISSVEAPFFSSVSTSPRNLFLISLTGTTCFNVSLVSPSLASTIFCLNTGCADDSSEAAKRLPTCTPSAPRAKAASICLPVPMPPAAMTGISTVFRTNGTSTIVVVSSKPLCPPASNPSATTASTPASCALTANLVLATTCTTVMPCSLNNVVYFLGLPAEVKTIFTFSRKTISMISSICG